MTSIGSSDQQNHRPAAEEDLVDFNLLTTNGSNVVDNVVAEQF